MKHLSANILLCSLLICNGCDNSHEPYNNGYDKRMPLTVRATAAGFAPLLYCKTNFWPYFRNWRYNIGLIRFWRMGISFFKYRRLAF